jgi:NTP pyrophosphatase (non-canonical NTP hydrolase)
VAGALLLEVSEFIESLRGKGDSSPEEEAGDVLFVLFSAMKHHGVSIEDALRSVQGKTASWLALGRRPE